MSTCLFLEEFRFQGLEYLYIDMAEIMNEVNDLKITKVIEWFIRLLRY